MHPVHYVEGPSGPPATAGKKTIKGTKMGGGKGSGGGFVGFFVKVTALTCAGVIGHLHGAAIVDVVEENLGHFSADRGKSRSGGRQ